MIDEAYKKFRRDWDNMDGGKHDAGNPTGLEIWHSAWKAATERAAKICDDQISEASSTGWNGCAEMCAYAIRTPSTKEQHDTSPRYREAVQRNAIPCNAR